MVPLSPFTHKHGSMVNNIFCTVVCQLLTFLFFNNVNNFCVPIVSVDMLISFVIVHKLCLSAALSYRKNNPKKDPQNIKNLKLKNKGYQHEQHRTEVVLRVIWFKNQNMQLSTPIPSHSFREKRKNIVWCWKGDPWGAGWHLPPPIDVNHFQLTCEVVAIFVVLHLVVGRKLCQVFLLWLFARGGAEAGHVQIPALDQRLVT